jgi:RHS repeat-associated protein
MERRNISCRAQSRHLITNGNCFIFAGRFIDSAIGLPRNDLSDISGIEVWNRTDAVPERLDDFYVFVSDVPFTSGNLNDTINQSGVWSQHYSSYPNPSTSVPVGRSGRYVRIQLGDTNYLSLGEVKVFASNSTEAISTCDNPFLFTGREYDYETGLYYYRARYYNPEIGRFLQTDPIGYDAGMNWYNYCGGNPLNYTDPTGNWTYKATIPVRCFSDVPGKDPKADVEAFLKEVGFYNYFSPPRDPISLSEVKVDNDNYICTFVDALNLGIEPPINITSRTLGSFPVVLVNGLGLLDNRLLDKVMEDRVAEFRIHFNNVSMIWQINLYRYWWDLLGNNCDTLFNAENWLYKGNKYTFEEVNDIGEGYIMAYLGFPETFGRFCLTAWEISDDSPKLPSQGQWYWWYMGRIYYQTGEIPDPFLVYFDMADKIIL